MSIVADAPLAAALFAVDPAGTGGVCLRSQPQPAREQWLQILRQLLPPPQQMRRVPCSISDNRLLGGMDLVATLKANRALAERGVLAEMDGGVLIVAMAERLSGHTAACINAALDDGEIQLSREGVALRFCSRIGVVALDEGISDDEHVPRSMLDRLAFLIDLGAVSARTALLASHDVEQIRAARALLPQVHIGSELVEALCATALALGAGSPRISLLACRVARMAAALEQRIEVTEQDASVAGRLVLGPRATLVPAPESTPEAAAETQQDESHAHGSSPPPAESSAVRSEERASTELDSKILQAAKAAIPGGLLASLAANADRSKTKARSRGRAGALRNAAGRGRPSGVLHGAPQGDARLNVTATLRAAALWQRLRGRKPNDGRIRIESADFRITRYKQRARTLTIFAVDASGSAALHRLAEAKGAVELLLADCYIRRDLVAVIAFRGRTAELLLPPTRSLVRAKRSLAGLPGGGGTPIAAAIEAASSLAHQAQRRGESATIVLLSDGRANVSRTGEAGRDAAHRDALNAAKTVRSLDLPALFVDTSPRPNDMAKELAACMSAKYVPLPYVSAQALTDIVKDVTRSFAC